MTKISIILGSTRENRTGIFTFNYFKTKTKQWEEKYGIKLNFVDLKDLNLPFFYEAQAPLANPNRRLEGSQQEWLDTLQSSDGFIFLTPEYNWATTAVLRNALDYVAFQLKGKAVRVISYAPHPGGGFEGGRDLAVLTGKLGAFVLPTPVTLRSILDIFNVDGTLKPNNESTEELLNHMMDELVFYTNLYKNNPYSKKD